MYTGRREMCERTIVEIVKNVECGPVKLSAIAGDGDVGVYATVVGVHGDLEEIFYPDEFGSEDEVLEAVYDLAVSAFVGRFRYKNKEVRTVGCEDAAAGWRDTFLDHAGVDISSRDPGCGR